MLSAAAVVAASYAIGSIPVGYLTGRVLGGVDLREYGSGNTGASNVYQSVSRRLVAPVGLAQIAQGLAGPLIARAAGLGDGVGVIAGIAAVAANDWNPWLRFSGGRGVGQAIGFMLGTSPAGLGAFVVVSLAGVALRSVPQGVGLGLLAAPVAAGAAGQDASLAGGLGVVAAIVLAKRVLANGAPEAPRTLAGVWLTRLVYDRDIRDREAWVRRGLDAGR